MIMKQLKNKHAATDAFKTHENTTSQAPHVHYVSRTIETNSVPGIANRYLLLQKGVATIVKTDWDRLAEDAPFA